MLSVYTLLVVLLTIPVACLYSSIGEWTLHKHFMHRPLWGFYYPFQTHTKVHHHLMRADETYHLDDLSLKDKVRMAWWNGPVIIAIGGIPFYIAAYAVGMFSMALFGWAVGLTAVAIFCANYVVYEWLHWCMHLPANRRVESSWIFRRLNGHHVLHHRYMGHNFNMVLPVADWLFGTLLLRSKKPFSQVRGPSVPDVQPLPA